MEECFQVTPSKKYTQNKHNSCLNSHYQEFLAPPHLDFCCRTISFILNIGYKNPTTQNKNVTHNTYFLCDIFQTHSLEWDLNRSLP